MSSLPPVPIATRNTRSGPAYLEHVDEAGRRWSEPRSGFQPRHSPGVDDWRCFYCSGRQFAALGTFRRHVITQHGEGLAKRLGLLPLEPGEPLPR